MNAPTEAPSGLPASPDYSGAPARNPHSKLSKIDLIWGLLAQGLNVGFMFIMLPVILHFLSKAEVSIWLVFAAITGAVQLMELGFQYVLARSFSYVYAGAQELLPSGLHDSTGPFSNRLLGELVTASRRIYLVIASLAATALWSGGTYYLYSIRPSGLNFEIVLWSWLAFSSGSVVNLYYGYLNALLQGRGDIRLANKVMVVAKLTQLVFCNVILIVFHGGLIGLGAATLLYTVTNRFLSYRYAYAPSRPEMRFPPPDREQVRRTVKALWHNAGRYGAAVIGAFLISRANILVAAGRIGVVETSGYSLALQLLMILQLVSMLPFNLSLPRLSHLRVVGDTKTAYRVFSSAQAAGNAVFCVGAIALFCGNPVLRLLGSSIMLPKMALLVPMALIYLLELNHGNSANMIAAGNEVPFSRAGLVTGICIFILGWTVAPYLGVAGLIAVVGLCQLAYNNWKWPIEVARQLHVGYLKLLQDGFIFLFRSLRA